MAENNLRSAMEEMFFTKRWRLTISDLIEYTGESEENIKKVLKEMRKENLIEMIDCHYEVKIPTRSITRVDIYNPKYNGIIKYLINNKEIKLLRISMMFPENDVLDVLRALSNRGVNQIGAKKYVIQDYARVILLVHNNPGISFKSIILNLGLTREEAKAAIRIALSKKNIVIREMGYYPQ